MKKTFLIIFYLFTGYSFGQNFQLIDTSDTKEREKLVTYFKNKYDVFNNNIKQTYKGQMRKEIMDFYQSSQTSVLEIIVSKKLLFDMRFQNYLDSLYLKIRLANPVLENEKINLYVSKNTSPNAISVGDGTIIMNIGLFCFLENEYQLQSVLSHEIGHQLLQHTKENIEKRAAINTNVLSNRSLDSRSIRTEKYNKGTRSFNLLKNLLYEEGETRRQQEIEADSMGYVLYKNTSLPKNEYINALATLNSYDSVPSIIIDSLTYHKIFNLPEQNFKEAWFKNEDFKSYNYEFYTSKIDVDSLKEHPDIQIRIDKLKSSFTELQNENDTAVSSDSFKKLQEIASRAYVENLYYLNEYGLSIYLIIKRLENDISDTYYKKWLGVNFEGLYEAKKKYQLNRYVDRIIPNEQSKSYQTFLNFIWNLNLNEIKTIADYYNSI